MTKETENNISDEEYSRMWAAFTNDRAELANRPSPGRIPAWWLLEGTPEQIAEWQRQIAAGEAMIE